MPRSAVVLTLALQFVTIVPPVFAASVPGGDSAYTVAMDYAAANDILVPMTDGEMHPEAPLSRMEMVKGVVHAVYAKDIDDRCFNAIAPSLPARYTRLFTDVSRDSTAAREVCVGMLTGILDGDPNGALRPYDGANLAEAAKMITQAYGIAPFQGLMPQPKTPWHERYWFALASRNAIPDTLKTRDARLTRGDFAEIVFRLQDVKPLYGSRFVPTYAKDGGMIAGAFTVFEQSSAAAVLTQAVAVPAPAPVISEPGRILLQHVADRRVTRLERLAFL